MKTCIKKASKAAQLMGAACALLEPLFLSSAEPLSLVAGLVLVLLLLHGVPMFSGPCDHVKHGVTIYKSESFPKIHLQAPERGAVLAHTITS